MSVTYRFDTFSLETRTRRLLEEGREIHISPKAFELLEVLLENRHRAISKADLHARIWPETFVTETNLTGLVAELRRALHDSAEEPRYIRTVHRFGYWFIADARSVGGTEGPMRRVRYWLFWDTRQIPLDEGENIIGRGADASVWIDAPGVSRHHALIRLDASGATVEDLGSKNGTFLRGSRVAGATRLEDGDQIRLGPVVLTFRIPAPAGTTETAYR
jgi:DNA-binding winged helix-turn-helix (wHTH) protein